MSDGAGGTRRSLTRAAVRVGPGGIWLGLRMLAWRAALPQLKRVMPLTRLTRLAWPSRRVRGGIDRALELRIAAIVGRLCGGHGSRWGDNCLERSLLAYRFLAQAGAEPQLVWGMRRREGELVGHAWVVLDGSPLTDAAEEVESFTPISIFGRGGCPCPDLPRRPVGGGPASSVAAI